MDASTNQPLPGAMATLSNPKTSYSLITAADGTVQIPVTENGNYSLITQKDEYVSEKVPVSVNCIGRDCKTGLSVSMVIKSQAGGIEILLNRT